MKKKIKILSNNIKQMDLEKKINKKSVYYNSGKELADDLGLLIRNVTKKKWVGSTTKEWKEIKDNLEKKRKQRDKKYNKTRLLAEKLQVSTKNIGERSNGLSKVKIDREYNRLKSIENRRDKIEKKNKLRKESSIKISAQIRDGKYQDIISGVVSSSNPILLTEDQAKELWSKIVQSAKHMLVIEYNTGEIQSITISNKSKDFFIHIMTNGMVINKLEEFGSDVLDEFDFQDIISIKLVRLKEPEKNIPNKDGQFFSYINNTEEDLSRYQIYNQKQAIDDEMLKNREHCLIDSLLKSGVSYSLVNSIKLSIVKGASFRKRDLIKVVEKIGRNIFLYTYRNNYEKQMFEIIGKLECVEPVKIALYKNHYFIMEDTKYTKFSITNYEEVKDIEDFHDITKFYTTKKGKKSYKREKKGRINSLTLVHDLFKKGSFKRLDLQMFEESSTNTELKNHIYLDNVFNEQRICCDKKNKKVPVKDIYYADAESFVKGVPHHSLYLMGVVPHDNDEKLEIYNICDMKDGSINGSREKQVVNALLNNVTSNGTKNALVYFHNLKYDYHLIEKHINIRDKCEKDGKIYNCMISYKGKTIELRDSLCMLSSGLAECAKKFGLPEELRKNEAICYEYYTEENNNKIIPVKDYRKLLSVNKKKIFDIVVKNCKSYNSADKTFNPLVYYKSYLKLDCLVLKHSMVTFNKLIGEITDNKMNVYSSLTISSLTDNYMKVEGAYKDIYEVCGNLREYISKAIYGGRVCVNKKYQKKLIEKELSNYDGCSLYSSAISRLCKDSGIAKGRASRYVPSKLKDWKDKFYSILTVRITAVNKKQQMPFIANRLKDSIKYTNEVPPDEIIIDSITLEDYIKFHEIEYELIDGVYWNNGGNKRMGEIIEKLYKSRLEYKKTNNEALANTLKLMLNSSYGKTVTKKVNSKNKITKNEIKKKNKKTDKWETITKTNIDNYIYNNFNTIISLRQLNKNTWEFKELCADMSYNRGHIGCSILSMSKRIMNEVFDVANENKYPIYYTDTDSIHCNRKDIPLLELKYNEKYNKVLNGKELGQFHSDFQLKGAREEIYAIKSIFLGKKSYMDYLESKDADGNIIHGYHIKLKGITKEGLTDCAKKYDDSYLGMFTELANNEELEIILNPYNKEENSNKVLFDFKNGKVSTKKEFRRKISFLN